MRLLVSVNQVIWTKLEDRNQANPNFSSTTPGPTRSITESSWTLVLSVLGL